MKPLRVALLLVACFAAGGAATEVGLRARYAVQVAKEERDAADAKGDLVALQIRDHDGELVAQPRVLTWPGKPARLLLRDPADPRRVRLALRMETVREPTGAYTLQYSVELPGAHVLSLGRVDLRPGVERPLDLGDGGLRAVVVALPVPSAAFDAWIAAERAAGRAPRA